MDVATRPLMNNPPATVPPTPPLRRVVIEHTVGPYLGLREIMGVWEPLPEHEVPTFVPNVLAHDNRRLDGITLVRATPRILWYRETVKETA